MYSIETHANHTNTCLHRIMKPKCPNCRASKAKKNICQAYIKQMIEEAGWFNLEEELQDSYIETQNSHTRQIIWEKLEVMAVTNTYLSTYFRDIHANLTPRRAYQHIFSIDLDLIESTLGPEFSLMKLVQNVKLFHELDGVCFH